MYLPPVNTYFARALEAVFAITVLARLETAVITSISFSEVGGLSLMLVSLGRVTSHEGIYIKNLSAQTSPRPEGTSRTERNFSISAGMQSPVGNPKGDNVASQP